MEFSPTSTRYPLRTRVSSLLGTVALALSLATPSVASEIRAYGINDYGQLNIPTGLTNVLNIAAGGNANLALRRDGTVEAWGEDDFPPAGLNSIVGIAKAPRDDVAFTDYGRVVGWGYHVGVTPNPHHVVAVACGGFRYCLPSQDGFAAALTVDGKVVAWGGNAYNQTDVPTNMGKVVAIACGTTHGVALLADGHVACWGDNTWGQQNIPAGLSNVVAIAAGPRHSLAVTRSGDIVPWGYRDFGMTTVPPGLSNVVDVAAGGDLCDVLSFRFAQSLALTASGDIVGWGYLPPPAGMTNNVLIAAGVRHGIRLMSAPPGTAPPEVVGTRRLLGTLTFPFYHRITAANGVDQFGVDNLPPGLSLDPVSGIISGTPTQAGWFDAVFRATNSLGNDSLAVAIIINSPTTNLPLPELAAPASLDWAKGEPLDFVATNLGAAGTFSADGLPPGLQMDAVSGHITGVPTQSGDFAATVRIRNSFGVDGSPLFIRITEPRLRVWAIGDGRCMVELTAAAGHEYEVRTSPSLPGTHWQLLRDIAMTEVLYSFPVTNDAAQLFFRANLK